MAMTCMQAGIPVRAIAAGDLYVGRHCCLKPDGWPTGLEARTR